MQCPLWGLKAVIRAKIAKWLMSAFRYGCPSSGRSAIGPI